MGNQSATLEVDEEFQVEVSKVMGRVRSALTGMFAPFPEGVRKSRDVQKYLGVDANLSWQVFKLLATSDALGASRFVPAAVSMRRVFDAARERGMEPRQVEAAESAIGEFEELIRRHAGDRSNFESMVAGIAVSSDSESTKHTDLQNRKAIFKGHSYYWGMQLDTRAVTLLLHPNRDNPEKVDYGHLASMLGLKRFRPEANLLVHRYNLTNFGDPLFAPRHDVMDRASMDLCGAPAIARFCTEPLPSFHTVTGSDGAIRSELVSETVGQKSRVDLTFGTLTHNAPISRTLDGSRRFVGPYPRIWLPTKLLLINLVMYRPVYPREKLYPSLKVLGHAAQTKPGDLTDLHGLLPFSERLAYLGPASTSAHTLEAPRYEEMLQFACETQDWDIEDFDIYRAKIEYPLLDTTIAATLEMD
jgi:hypothetical protein